VKVDFRANGLDNASRKMGLLRIVAEKGEDSSVALWRYTFAYRVHRAEGSPTDQCVQVRGRCSFKWSLILPRSVACAIYYDHNYRNQFRTTVPNIPQDINARLGGQCS
jgi:hypothetical protein